MIYIYYTMYLICVNVIVDLVLMYYNYLMGKKSLLKESEERIAELEDLYVITRNKFLTEFDDLDPQGRERYLRQLRGMLDDIAKEAGGRVKRQENINTFGATDNSFMELIAGIRGNLPEPSPVIDVMPLMAEQVFGGEEEERITGNSADTTD